MTINSKINRFFSATASISKSLFFLALFIPILFLGCDTDSVKDSIKEKIDEVLSDQTDVHVAFAGGGWRAHTGHSAWVISLLDNQPGGTTTTLDAAFKNVNTISSNSGGSWFSTMLMYSQPFVNDIQAPNAINTWDTTGWIGLQKKHFDAATYDDWGTTEHCSYHLGNPPNSREEGEYIDCVANNYAKTATHWKKIIDDLIFKDYSLDTMKLSDPKLQWANDKSLLIASSLLNNSVVLNAVEDDFATYRYYQACFQTSPASPNLPVLEGYELKKQTTCSAGFPVDVAAVTFTSLAADSKLTPLTFFRGLDSISSTLNIGYTLDKKLKNKPLEDSTTIKSPLNYGNVPVMTAAAASSAAAGFAASEHVIKGFPVAYEAEDLALSFKLGNSTVAFADMKSMPFDSLVDNKVVRLADGGPVDNSGVAQIVSFLQKNKQDDGFNIVAFDNVADLYTPGGKGAKVGIDIASLFGAPDTFSGKFSGMKFIVETPKLQIFVKDTMTNTPVTWTHPAGNGQQIFYTKYNVTTIDNEALGITKNSTGILHAFTYASENAAIMPYQGDVDFKAYSDMITYIDTCLQANNGAGLYHLRQAFGSTTAD